MSFDVKLRPDQIADLFEVAASEQQTIAEMDACWTRLRASHLARERIQHLSPSEIREALQLSRRVLAEEDDR